MLTDLQNLTTFSVISDVHLRDPADATTQLFIETLNSFKGPHTVFLLGDIFDFIFAGSHFFENYWAGVFDCLKKLHTRGIGVVFVEGNHDFGFTHYCPATLKRTLLSVGDEEVSAQHAVLGRIAFRHGDDIVCAPEYLKFRKLVKAKGVQKVVRAFIPGAFMHAVFSRYARASRKKDKYRTLAPVFVRKCIENHFREKTGARGMERKTPRVLILGHLHAHIDATVSGVRVLVGPDWFSAPNILECTVDGNFHRRYLTSKTQNRFELEGPK